MNDESGRVIIIGAPRSGTNMLRDVLLALPGMATWPCDEINYLWRHGNIGFPTDEFPPDLATPAVAEHMTRRFAWVKRRFAAETVIEKTCANSLRVGYVDRAVPGAKYVFIHRNGWDVVASAMKRWRAGLEPRYLAKKARFVPFSDLPYYGLRYLWSHLYRLLPGRERLAFWGPRFEGMEEALRHRSLVEVCALQWARCVERAVEDLSKLPPERVHVVDYDRFVAAPEPAVEEIVSFLGRRVEALDIVRACALVSDGSVGHGRAQIPSDQADRIAPLIADVQRRLETFAVGRVRVAS